MPIVHPVRLEPQLGLGMWRKQQLFLFEVYPVEKLVGHRKGKGGRLEFLVRWEGYGEADDSWEPRSNLEGSLVQDYVNSADP